MTQAGWPGATALEAELLHVRRVGLARRDARATPVLTRKLDQVGLIMTKDLFDQAIEQLPEAMRGAAVDEFDVNETTSGSAADRRQAAALKLRVPYKLFKKTSPDGLERQLIEAMARAIEGLGPQVISRAKVMAGALEAFEEWRRTHDERDLFEEMDVLLVHGYVEPQYAPDGCSVIGVKTSYPRLATGACAESIAYYGNDIGYHVQRGMAREDAMRRCYASSERIKAYAQKESDLRRKVGIGWDAHGSVLRDEIRKLIQQATIDEQMQ